MFADFLSPRFRPFAPWLLLIGSVIAAYANIYGNDFLYDDPSLIVDNRYLRGWNHFGEIFTSSLTSGSNVAGGFYRPMQTLVYWVVFQLFGLSHIAFHLLNVSLHAANACLIFTLGQRLGFTPKGALIAALLWALHPAHVEAITYMSGTAEPLYTFFTLSGLCVLFPNFSLRRIFYAVPLFILALLSKETAVLFPFLVCACLALHNPQRIKIQTYLPTFLLWVVAITYLIIHQILLSVGQFNIYTQHDLYAQSILCRIYTFLGVLPSYLQILLWPVGLHFDRNFPAIETPINNDVLAGILIVSLSIVPFTLRTKACRIASWSVLWFAAAHLLNSGIFVPVNAILLEHWLYLPSIGFFLAAGEGLASLKQQKIAFSQSSYRRRPVSSGERPRAIKATAPYDDCFSFGLTIAVTAGIALILATLTFLQNPIWKNDETLYLNIFASGEPSPHAHNNLAIIYTKRGDYDKAIEQYKISIALSGDNNAQAQHNLGITLLSSPNGKALLSEAITHFKRALEIDPSFAPAKAALDEIYRREGISE